jgi:hypothetical protein
MPAKRLEMGDSFEWQEANCVAGELIAADVSYFDSENAR